jgi:methionine-rich copper-binding protein CopC
MRILQTVIVFAVLAAPAALSPVPSAWSHATLIKSSPANGMSLRTSPTAIRAWFSEELAVKGSALRLLDSHQKQLAAGGVDVGVSKHDVMKITPPALKPGAYAVQWTAISADDTETRKGSFQFSVGGGATTSPGPTASLPPLRLVAPALHASVKNPVSLIIETPGDITQMTTGGHMADMSGMGSQAHLHINVDSMMIMPMAKQLTKVGPNRYAFAVPPMSPGTHTIKVYWADDKTHTLAGHVQMTMCTVTE